MAGTAGECGRSVTGTAPPSSPSSEYWLEAGNPALSLDEPCWHRCGSSQWDARRGGSAVGTPLFALFVSQQPDSVMPRLAEPGLELESIAVPAPKLASVSVRQAAGTRPGGRSAVMRVIDDGIMDARHGFHEFIASVGPARLVLHLGHLAADKAKVLRNAWRVGYRMECQSRRVPTVPVASWSKTRTPYPAPVCLKLPEVPFFCQRTSRGSNPPRSSSCERGAVC